MELNSAQRKAFQIGSVGLILAGVALVLTSGWVAALPLFAGGGVISVVASQASEPGDSDDPETSL